MALIHVQVLAAIALSLSLLMALAWIVQQRTGNSGWVDAIWTYSVGLISAIVAAWPLEDALPARQLLVVGLILLWSLRLGTHIALRSLGSDDDPRYASYAREWGPAAPSARAASDRARRSSAARTPHGEVRALAR